MAGANEPNKPDISDESFTTRMLYKMIRSKFPRVQQLSTDALHDWLADDNIAKQILLLDIREAEEREVSYIKDSVHVLPSDNSFSHQIQRIKECNITRVVAFCSVGYRSSAFAKRLYSELQCNEELKEQQVEIYNLEGSIFKWANENKPLVDKHGQTTIFAHPYNAIWGKFLEEHRRKYVETANL